MTGFMETIINLVFSLYHWFICWTILLDYQGGVILRLGRFHRLATPGWNWRLPFGLEQVLLTNVVPTTADLQPQAIITTVGVTVLVETVILWGVTSPRKYLLEVESAVAVLCEAGQACIYDIVSQHSWKGLQDSNIDDQLTQEIRARSKKWGVRIFSVQITSLSRLSLRDGCLRIANPSVMIAA